jgi:hypothetical protein
MRRNEDLRRSGKLNLQEMRPEIQIQRLQKRTDRENEARDHRKSNANVGNSARGSKGAPRNEYRENDVNGVEGQAEMKQLARERERELKMAL